MEKIKIWFTDFWPEWNIENFITPVLEKHFEVVLDSVNPDVVFHSIFNRMSETPKYKCKKVLILAENYRPSNFGSDYSISFDPHSETNYKLPLWQIYCLLKPEIKEKLFFEPRVNVDKFDRGGSFVVSNAGNFFRNGFYDMFSMSSSIAFYSYGKYKTNDYGLIRASEGKYWRDAKYEFFEKYRHKYAIVFENNAHPYYCTEKLMDAFLCASLPLYWGDTKVNDDWNKEAFINVLKIGQQAAYDLVVSMERDNSIFEKMYSQPIFTEEQRDRHLNNMDKFEDWLVKNVK